jgi:outer membrane protein OmpA-like peptidoglycan-associated protein
MKFCTKCGNRLEPGLKFCTRCGAAVADSTAQPMADVQPELQVPAPVPEPAAGPPSASPSPVGEWQALPAAPVVQPAAAPVPASANSSCLPALLIGLAVLALIAVLGIGGAVYFGYKMKQKATAMLHQAESKVNATSPSATGDRNAVPGATDKPGETPQKPQDEAANLLGGLTNLLNAAGNGGEVDDGDPVESVSDRDPVEPCPPAQLPSQTNARVPLREGTIVTTAWGVKYGDVEMRFGAGKPMANAIELNESDAAYKNDNGDEQRATSHDLTVCAADLASSMMYVTNVGTNIPHLIHGITRLRLSDAAFKQITTAGKVDIDYLSHWSVGDGEKPYHDTGTLTRVEPGDVPYPMIVNDERVTLPTIHLSGVYDSAGKDPRPKKDRPHHAATDVYVVDDPADPLVLLWKMADPAYHEGKFRIEVVKIEYKTANPVNLVEKQLTEQKRAVTYGIYFDFNKDTIKPESEPVLKEIVQAMTDNPTWKLTVEGHTDNIGGDVYNLDLSKRRAAAVKQALVTRFHIAPERLSTDGFGALRPVETNDTLEGRARNRRVELTRE